jgi:hypothetical protein
MFHYRCFLPRCRLKSTSSVPETSRALGILLSFGAFWGLLLPFGGYWGQDRTDGEVLWGLLLPFVAFGKLLSKKPILSRYMYGERISSR